MSKWVQSLRYQAAFTVKIDNTVPDGWVESVDENVDFSGSVTEYNFVACDASECRRLDNTYKRMYSGKIHKDIKMSSDTYHGLYRG